MRSALPRVCWLLIYLLLSLTSITTATAASTDDTTGVTIIFPNKHVGPFHLTYLYPTTTRITATTTIHSITSSLAALVNNITPPSTFTCYTTANHTTSLQPDQRLGERSVLYVDVVLYDDDGGVEQLVDGLSEGSERRLLEVVEKLDGGIVQVVRDGQTQLAVAAEEAEQLANDAAAQRANVQLLQARLHRLEKLMGKQDKSSLQTVEEAVEAAAAAVGDQLRLTADLQADVAETQRLLARILRAVAKVGAIVEEVEGDLRYHSAGEEETELAAAKLIVKELTEVVELGVKAAAEAHDILADLDEASAAAELVEEDVEAAEGAVDEAETALRYADVQAQTTAAQTLNVSSEGSVNASIAQYGGGDNGAGDGGDNGAGDVPSGDEPGGDVPGGGAPGGDVPGGGDVPSGGGSSGGVPSGGNTQQPNATAPQLNPTTPQLNATTPKLNTTTVQQLNATTVQQLNSTTVQHLNVTAVQLNTTAVQQLNATTVQQINTTTVQQLNTTALQLNATAVQMNATTVQQLNSTTVQQLNATTVQQLNVTIVRQINSTIVQQLNATQISQLNVTSLPQLNATTVQTPNVTNIAVAAVNASRA